MEKSIDRLLAIMQTLRGPAGCDWDKEQNLQSLKPYLLEEAYEVIDTIDGIDENNAPPSHAHHREELGDLLLQVVFQAQIQAELGNFTFDDVAKAICEKMERRHPHIFGDQPRDGKVKGNPYWHAIKDAEKGKDASLFDSIPKGQPTLLRARKLGERVARFGFDWENAHGAFQKIHEEVRELEQAMANGDQRHAQEELGDLLFAIAQVARHLTIDPEIALHQGNEKFVRRMARIIDEAGGLDEFKKLSLDEKEALWQKNKNTP